MKADLILANKFQLLTKTAYGKFDSRGKKEILEKDVQITQEQLIKHRRSASKSGVLFVEVVTK